MLIALNKSNLISKFFLKSLNMKSRFILIFLFFLFSNNCCFCQRTESEILKFRQYYSKFNHLPDSGFVKNKFIAEKIASIYLESIYGESIKKYFPLESILVENNTIWCVIGKNNPDQLGGPPYMEIRRKDGAILKVANSK